MLFNSIEFALFLAVVFGVYWFVLKKHRRAQNLFLLAASYFFYGWWDWRFLSLIFISSLVDYLVGLRLPKLRGTKNRKILLFVSIFVNIGFLGFFKYFDFFSESFANAFSLLGMSLSPSRLRIVLPVGISFYTFQTLSYTIDIYRNKLKPTKDIISFFAFVSFFPQLVAGPIERASNLLPQFARKRTFDHESAVDGMRQILWGLFKKIVIADNCAIYVEKVFGDALNQTGSSLLLGSVLFAFQIYGDFSGYSDIAIGSARLFGFKLMRNFAFPYFSRDMAEFWRRWHISLSTWFRDYIYIPLGGSKVKKIKMTRNIFVIFLLSGLWHGANWTFLLWGFVNACYVLPLAIMGVNRKHTNIVAEFRPFPTLVEILQILGTFLLTSIAWIFFRAQTVSDAFSILGRVFSPSLFSIPHSVPPFLILSILGLVVIEWFQRKKQHGLEISRSKNLLLLRWTAYLGIFILIIALGGSQQEFIYFQF